MSYIVKYSPLALKDMDAVWDEVFLTSQSYDVADRYVLDFADKIAEKKEYPQSGIPLLYRGLFTGFYSVNFKAYKAFYRVRGNCIEYGKITTNKSSKIGCGCGVPLTLCA